MTACNCVYQSGTCKLDPCPYHRHAAPAPADASKPNLVRELEQAAARERRAAEKKGADQRLRLTIAAQLLAPVISHNLTGYLGAGSVDVPWVQARVENALIVADMLIAKAAGGAA